MLLACLHDEDGYDHASQTVAPEAQGFSEEAEEA